MAAVTGRCRWTIDQRLFPVHNLLILFLFFFKCKIDFVFFNLIRNDWVLKIVYRTASAAYDVAGLEGVHIQHDKFVNVDLSHLINGIRYMF